MSIECLRPFDEGFTITLLSHTIVFYASPELVGMSLKKLSDINPNWGYYIILVLATGCRVWDFLSQSTFV